MRSPKLPAANDSRYELTSPMGFELVFLGAPVQMEEVLGALTNLADTHPQNQGAIAAAGAVGPLVLLLKNGSAAAKEEVRLCLSIYLYIYIYICI